MSANDVELAKIDFAANLVMALQQDVSLLRGRVYEKGGLRGKQVSMIDYVTAVQAKTPSGRFQLLDREDPSYTRRWVVPQDKELPQFFDTFDELRLSVNPMGQAAPNAASAFGRSWDDALIAAAFASAQISNTDGTTLTTETFDTSTYGISEKFGDGSTSVGLTVAKLREARRIFRHHHVRLETAKLTAIFGSQQEADLLSQVEVLSSEYNIKPRLDENGNIRSFYGFECIISERLAHGTGIGSSSNVRKCIVFEQMGLALGMWNDLETNVSKETLLSSQPWLVYAKSTYGATRLEPGRLLRVDCGNDTTGDDINP